MHLHPKRAFTLTELLAVIACVSLLLALLLPTVDRVRKAGNQAKCMANLRQISATLQTYASDNNGKTVEAVRVSSGTWKNWASILTAWDGSNSSLVSSTRKGTFGIWRCPENKAQVIAPVGFDGGESQGSYTINGWAKTTDENFDTENRYTNNYLAKFSQPSKLYMVYEGAYCRGELTPDDGKSSVPETLYAGKGIRSARYAHQGSLNMVFADGHAERLPGPVIGRGTALGGSNNRAASFSNGTSWFAN